MLAPYLSFWKSEISQNKIQRKLASWFKAHLFKNNTPFYFYML